MENLAHKIKKGFLWAGFGTFAGRGLQFISDVVLSRLLFPEDFGLMAIGLAILNISEMLTETGFNSALIQKQGDVKKYLNTAWTMEVIKSFILFTIGYVIAKPLSIFYDDPSVLNVLRGISLLFLFRGFRNVGIIYFRKNLEINKHVIMDIVPSIIQLILVIPLAYLLHNVWAIILSVYGRRLAELIMSFWMHKYRPRFEFQMDSFKELFNFGKWIFGLSIIGAIRKNLVPLFIGKYFNMETLGYYNRAELLSVLLFSVIGEIIWKVGYPVMSQLQSDENRLKKFYLDLMLIILYFGIPISMSLVLFSEELIQTIFSEKWLPSVHMLNLLVIAGFISFASSTSSIMLQAIGKPKLGLKISTISIIIILIAIYPLSNYAGMSGLILSMIVSRAYSLFHAIYYIIKMYNINMKEMLRPLILSIFNCIIFITPITIVKLKYINSMSVLVLLTYFVTGLIFFTALALLWRMIFKYNIVSVIFPLLKTKQNRMSA